MLLVTSVLILVLSPFLVVMSVMTYLAAFLVWRKTGGFSDDQEIKLQNFFMNTIYKRILA
ncbi:hypothetical protein A1359_10760 [Methylomonas lenta]|uniref:Uncharacterized protein n=1 Tax=Methylomonas lenta TaxID=980561 RepID=A0A177N8N9_9GAMM|nr:hypothetical protein A1359_10760 [Methylomonas lenta]